jgi:4,5-DOPA dioxygenase extradiol
MDVSGHNGQIIYFSHGGGPLPILNHPSHEKMIKFMNNLPSIIKRPDAIVVFSAHWEESIVAIQSGSKPELVYDYFGFPAAAYELKYPCNGNRALAARIADLFQGNGIHGRLDHNRPYDHGSYIPLIMMYPDADIPVLQVSLNHNLDPRTHLDMGRALRPLLDENILIIGSGFSFHNMRRFDFAGSNMEDHLNNEFQDRLIEICCGEMDETKKWRHLTGWENMPGARYCHPREEHLLPLLVCAGLAANNASTLFDDYILGKRATAFLWR